MLIKEWILPDKGYIKISMDASYIFSTGTRSIGLIIRDFAGNCLGVKGMTMLGMLNLEMNILNIELS